MIEIREVSMGGRKYVRGEWREMSGKGGRRLVYMGFFYRVRTLVCFYRETG